MSTRSGPRNAADRLRRLLVMLPWLMEAGEVPLSDVAARFDMTEDEVARDLELVAMCGLPPYVDEMVDVFVDEGMVFVGVPRLFTRPLRLTAPEGFSLLAAARAAMELPGNDPDGPLARGMAKLAETLGRAGLEPEFASASDDAADDTADDTAGVAVDLERPPVSDDIVDAVAAGSELRIDYYSPQRGDTSERTIVPRHVFAEAGRWYVVADDDRSQARRTFRIDRIESVEPTGVFHEVDPDVVAPEAFFSDAELPQATLRLDPDAQWIIDQYPTLSVEPAPGRAGAKGVVDVVLPVASDWWLSRLLVRLGPLATVIEPADAGSGANELARIILTKYR